MKIKENDGAFVARGPEMDKYTFN